MRAGARQPQPIASAATASMMARPPGCPRGRPPASARRASRRASPQASSWAGRGRRPVGAYGCVRTGAVARCRQQPLLGAALLPSRAARRTRSAHQSPRHRRQARRVPHSEERQHGLYGRADRASAQMRLACAPPAQAMGSCSPVLDCAGRKTRGAPAYAGATRGFRGRLRRVLVWRQKPARPRLEFERVRERSLAAARDDWPAGLTK